MPNRRGGFGVHERFEEGPGSWGPSHRNTVAFGDQEHDALPAATLQPNFDSQPKDEVIEGSACCAADTDGSDDDGISSLLPSPFFVLQPGRCSFSEPCWLELKAIGFVPEHVASYRL